jgi:hypothetical protein
MNRFEETLYLLVIMFVACVLAVLTASEATALAVQTIHWSLH